MAKIKANVKKDEYNNVMYHREFHIIDEDEFEEIKDHLEEVSIDIENNDETRSYEFYKNTDEDAEWIYVAVSKYRSKDITINLYMNNADVFVDGVCNRIDVDGIEFDDEEECEEFIYNLDVFDDYLTEDDREKVFDALRNWLDSRIRDEE